MNIIPPKPSQPEINVLLLSYVRDMIVSVSEAIT